MRDFSLSQRLLFLVDFRAHRHLVHRRAGRGGLCDRALRVQLRLDVDQPVQHEVEEEVGGADQALRSVTAHSQPKYDFFVITSKPNWSWMKSSGFSSASRTYHR